MLQALTVLTEVFRENVKNGRVKQGLLPAIGELVYLAASQVSQSEARTSASHRRAGLPGGLPGKS